ncbi:MAG: 4-hydroxy-tetrahydrodipicolinate reductase [Pseudomonadota bacterium]
MTGAGSGTNAYALIRQAMDKMIDTPLSIAVAGIAGRMGRQLATAVVARGHRLVGGTERSGSPELVSDLARFAGAEPPLGRTPDVDAAKAAHTASTWIDFTTPAATLAAMDALRSTPVQTVIIGTTGFDAEAEAALQGHADRFAIVKAGNFSLGVALLTALARLAAERLGAGWDAEILETHHRFKVDAPSGTALMLGDAVAAGRGAALPDLQAAPYCGPEAKREAGAIGFSVRRSGGVIGEHELTFTSETETVRLAHSAIDRSVFADGALAAAEWANGQPPGHYGIGDVLGV